MAVLNDCSGVNMRDSRAGYDIPPIVLAWIQEIEIDGTTREYSMLRIGRIGLYFQSGDTSVTGWWNAEIGDYEDLGNEHRNEVRKGIRVARQLIAPELVLLPVPAPVPVPAEGA